MQVTKENNELVIRIPMAVNPQPSASGKSLTVSSTRGNTTTDLVVGGHNLVIGLNAYIPNRPAVK